MKGFISKIGLLSLMIFFGCSVDDLDIHLTQMRKENSQICVDGWVVLKNSTSDVETYYSLGKQVEDTTYSFCFTYLRNNNEEFYAMDDFIKSYKENDSTYKMALYNDDTLYFYKCSSDLLNKPSGIPIQIDDFKFVKGKYYYLYKSGRLNIAQMEYFDKYKDSLIQIRGDKLPDLPGQ